MGPDTSIPLLRRGQEEASPSLNFLDIHKSLEKTEEYFRSKNKGTRSSNVVSVGFTVISRNESGGLVAFYDRLINDHKEELSFMSGSIKEGVRNDPGPKEDSVGKERGYKRIQALYSMTDLHGKKRFKKVSAIVENLRESLRIAHSLNWKIPNHDEYIITILVNARGAIEPLREGEDAFHALTFLDRIGSRIDDVLGSAFDSEQVFLQYMKGKMGSIISKLRFEYTESKKRILIKRFEKELKEIIEGKEEIEDTKGEKQITFHSEIKDFILKPIAIFIHLHSTREICEFCRSCICRELLLHHNGRKFKSEKASGSLEKGVFWNETSPEQPACMVLASCSSYLSRSKSKSSSKAGGLPGKESPLNEINLGEAVENGWFPQFLLEKSSEEQRKGLPANKKRRGTPKKLELKENT